METIDRSFAPADLATMLDACQTDGAVVVQASNSAGETRRLMSLSADRIEGVVGWADLTAEVEPQLEVLRPLTGTLIGLRHLVHLEPDPNWLLRAEVGRAFGVLADANLTFDLVLRPWQLPLAARVARQNPRTRFVLDHLGGLSESEDDVTWAADLSAFSDLPNVYAKISGLARAAANKERLFWAIGHALIAFSAERLMFGSDWPLAQLGVGAPAWRGTVESALTNSTTTELSQIFSGTATTFYGLDA